MRRLALLLAFTAILAQAEPFSHERFTVAPGIYAFIESFGHAVVSGNSTVIVGDEGVVVVDTGQHPAVTRRIIAEIRALTPKPVQYVVNTHWHNDHVAGNFLYAEAFPGVKFIAQRATADLMESETRVFQETTCQGFIRVQSKALREMLASGMGSDGTPLTDARRKRLEGVVEDADAASAECLEYRFRGADIAFDDRLTLRLGKREVQVMFLGRANTAGDAVVYVPDAKVLAVGDILVHPFPFAFQSYIGEWAAVLRRIDSMDAAAIVPGHGPVMRDRKYLTDVAELMEAIESQVRKAYEPGITLEDLRKKVDLAAFRARIAGTDPLLQLNFDAAVTGAAVARAWQAMRGHMEPEGLPKG
jgi:glyoxylase-like metal-dependent hydrolase (beta-lactamase superfamily II)